MIINEILKLLKISQIKMSIDSNPKFFTIDKVRNRAKQLPYMNFPKEEYSDIRQRFSLGKLVYTHRHNEEMEKYPNDIQFVNSPFGYLKIISNNILDDLYNDNKFKGEPDFERYKSQLIGKSGRQIALKQIKL